jgi:hypothetical protein
MRGGKLVSSELWKAVNFSYCKCQSCIKRPVCKLKPCPKYYDDPCYRLVKECAQYGKGNPLMVI